MREIKFRAWDKQKKRMIKVTAALFDYVNGELLEIDTDDNLNEPKNIEHFEIMQYTGLKDKNGVEIYEGDIIKDAKGDFFKIIYNVDKDYKRSMFIGKCIKQSYKCGDDNMLDIGGFLSVEVIGNIYEEE